jgi:hypothetical protein
MNECAYEEMVTICTLKNLHIHLIHLHIKEFEYSFYSFAYLHINPFAHIKFVFFDNHPAL